MRIRVETLEHGREISFAATKIREDGIAHHVRKAPILDLVYLGNIYDFKLGWAPKPIAMARKLEFDDVY